MKVAHVDLNGHRVSPAALRETRVQVHAVDPLFVDFASAEELIPRSAPAEAGMVFMPLDNYGFSFGWCSDRFGVSWQLNLPATSSAATRPVR